LGNKQKNVPDRVNQENGAKDYDIKQVGRKVAVNSMVGMVAVGIYFISRLALTPFILNYIDLAEFGLWSICFVILSYAGLGALGVNNAYVKFTAEYQSRQDHEAISSLLSTGILCMTLFCFFFYFALYLLLPYILKLFKVSSNILSVAAFMILGTALTFCFDFTLGGFRSTLEGLQEIAISKSINVAASLFEVALILVFIPMGFGIKGLLYAYFIKTVVEIIACTILVFRKLPNLTLKPSLIKKEAFRTLFVFGGKIQVIGALSIFLASLDRLLITSIIGLKATGLFEVGRKFPFTGRNISRAAFGPLLPAASYLGGKWERGETIPRVDRTKKYLGLILTAGFVGVLPCAGWIWNIWRNNVQITNVSYALAGLAVLLFIPLFIAKLRRLHGRLIAEDRLLKGELHDLYIKGMRHINLLNVTVFSFLMAAARPLIISWVGSDYLAATSVMVLISFSNMIHQGTGPASLIVRGIERVGRELEYLIIQFVLAVIWIPVGTVLFGITGTALGILGSAALGSFYFFWRTNHAFHITWNGFLGTVIRPGLAPAIAAASVYALTFVLPFNSRFFTAGMVIILGFYHLAVTFLLLWIFFFTSEEKKTVYSILVRLKLVKRTA